MMIDSVCPAKGKSHLPEKPTGNWKMIRFSQNDVKAKNAAAFPVR